jgi:hypothetical protein
MVARIGSGGRVELTGCRAEETEPIICTAGPELAMDTIWPVEEEVDVADRDIVTTLRSPTLLPRLSSPSSEISE